MSTKIEWAQETWNPIVGCKKVSPGCDNCYAERMAKRLSSMALKDDSSEGFDTSGKGKYALVTLDGRWNGLTWFDESILKKPFQWKSPKRIFITSMGDLFYDKVPFSWVVEIMFVIHKNPHHTFLMLTKRPERMMEFFTEYIPNPFFKPLPNLWLGVTAENQEMADKRIPILLQIPAAKHFVSIEPMLGPVDLFKIRRLTSLGYKTINSLSGVEWFDDVDTSRYNTWIGKLDWVICGGESGPGARPLHPDWVRSLRDQCYVSQTPFLFKQWGEYLFFEETAQQPFYRNSATGLEYDAHGMNFIDPYTGDPGKWKGGQWIEDFETNDGVYLKISKKSAGRKLDGKVWDEYPKP